MNLPQYTLRRSPRAKHVRLHITPIEGLVVVVPLRFDAARVPALLDAQRNWIDRKLATIECLDVDVAPPATIELKAIAQTFRVVYQSTGSGSVTGRQSGRDLILSGAVGDQAGLR